VTWDVGFVRRTEQNATGTTDWRPREGYCTSMGLRRLLTASALYGIGDMLVLAVGGFLLLPLYTRMLPQSDFGAYVIIKANGEIFQYILYFGLLSSVARIYFDYKPDGKQKEYLNSIVMFFFVVLLIAVIVLTLWGDTLWRLLSPATPPQPYVWYCLAIAAANFFASIGSLWLRLDENVKAFVVLQLVASVVLAAAAFLNLVVFKLGLSGLLSALVIGYIPATAVLLYRLGKNLKPFFRWGYVAESLRFGLPFAASSISYFILNRFSILTLQHFVPTKQIAIFGLAQQLAMLITIFAASLVKAISPAVFGASEAQALDLLHRSTKMFILVLFGISGLIVVFAREIILVAATSEYLWRYDALLILIIANFVYSLINLSNMALLFHRNTKILAANSIVGAAVSAGLSLLLIPRYHLVGGAVAVFGASLTVMVASYVAAWRLDRHSHFSLLATTIAAVCLLAVASAWLLQLDVGVFVSIGLKVVLTVVVFSAVYVLCAPKGFPRTWTEFGAYLRTK